MTELSILVVSCDKYYDIWGPFFEIFRKRWPDCPYKVYLGTNHIKYESPDVTTLAIGDDVDWASNLHRMLDQLNSERVIIFLEDFLLVGKVNTHAVEQMFALAKNHDVDCLRLRPSPCPSRKIPDLANLGIIEPGAEYRISTQVAIWKVKLLRMLARPGFSAWDFEILGTLLSDRLPGKYWGVYRPVIDYHHAVQRGLWLEEGLRICTQAGINPDPGLRGIMRSGQMFRNNLINLLQPKSLVAALLPGYFRRLIRLKRRRKEIDMLLSNMKVSAPQHFV